MKIRNLPRFLLLLTCALTGIEALGAVFYLLSIPSDDKGSLIFGYSAPRLALLAGLGIACLALAFLTFWLTRAGRAERLIARFSGSRRWSVWGLCLSAAGFLAFAVFSLLPAERLGRWQAYFQRLHPLWVWLALAFGQALLLLLFNWRSQQRDSESQSKPDQRATLRTAGIALAVMLMLALWAGVTGNGLTPDIQQWNETGTPVMGLQVMLALGLGLLAAWADSWLVRRVGPKGQIWFDALIFGLIWGIAALAWVSAPQPSMYFAPGPYPPTNDFAPFSDAAMFDMGAQYLLIGQKVMNGMIYDRTFYMGFLALLHVLVGQGYTATVSLQAGLYAVLPALFYLLGKRIYNRSLGIMLAALFLLREVNAIEAGRYIQGANSRLMSTDFATYLLVILATLLFVRWMQHPGRLAWAAALGGVLGLATMVRTNALVLLAFIPLLALPWLWRSPRRWLAGTAVFVLAAAIAIAPWTARNVQLGGKSNIYLMRIQNVLLHRYKPVVSTPQPTPTLAAQTETEITPTPGLAAAPTPKPPKRKLSTSEKWFGYSRFMAMHFSHGLIETALALPYPLNFNRLDATLQGKLPFWQTDWASRLTPGLGLGILINLALVSIGIGAAWRRWRFVGLIPLGVGLVYLFSNALARTSGGRYQVPADWLGYVYYALGLLQVVFWLAAYFKILPQRQEQSPVPPAPLKESWRVWLSPQLAGVLVLFLVLGSLLPLAERFIPHKYYDLDKITSYLQVQRLLEETAPVSAAELKAFVMRPDVVLREGTSLYLRFAAQDQGEPDKYSAYHLQPYPRLTFTQIGTQGELIAVLPLTKSPAGLMPGEDTLVLGCRGKGFVDAVALITLGTPNQIYWRDPTAPLNCPLKAPVCDDNRKCR